MALDELDNTYGPSDVVPLIWHVLDSLQTPQTQARYDYYGVSGIPDTFFDGRDDLLGGWPDIYDFMERIVLNHLGDDPYVAIDLSGSSLGVPAGAGRVEVSVHVRLTVEQSIPWGDVQAYVVLYEDSVEGQYMYTVREVESPEPVPLTAPGETLDFVRTFGLDPAWDPANVGVVVFVQSVGTKTVLNACRLSRVDAEITPDAASVPRGGTLDLTAALTNITSYPVSFEAWIDLILPNGNEYPGDPYLGPVPVSLASHGTVSQALSIPVPGGTPVGNYRLRLGVGNRAAPDHWEYDYMDVTVTP